MKEMPMYPADLNRIKDAVALARARQVRQGQEKTPSAESR
jgi:hypothetical protein